MPRSIEARSKVERAAIELFAAKGVDGVSIAEIAAAAGVSQGALYRYYPSKDHLAESLFSNAYTRTGGELAAIATRTTGFRARICAMVRHFCSLYDRDPQLFRFMLIAQHDLLPRLRPGEQTPVTAIADTVSAAAAVGEIGPVDANLAAAAVIGIVLQTAIFHIYGRLQGRLAPRAPGLAMAAIAAVESLSNTVSIRRRPKTLAREQSR